MCTPAEILESCLSKAAELGDTSAINGQDILGRIEYVCRCIGNRAGVRLLMSCMLAKIHNPAIDPRKPYTEIGGDDAFSGRTYDEQHLTGFITRHRLPCNHTTAFLTPALRNRDATFTTDVVIVGRPPQVYEDTIQLLDDVFAKRVSADDVLVDTLRILLLIRDEKQSRMETLIAALKQGDEAMPLASEQIVTLLGQHLACKHSSRLPVLIVAAAYQAASSCLGKQAAPLRGHLAADQQTGAGGDVEICLLSEESVCTIYEMKDKRVTQNDIDHAIEKIVKCDPRIDNYVFITTDVIECEVAEYAGAVYNKTGGIEVVILDCMGFIRHFLHLFHQSRTQFLNAYQDLVLAEPDSAVNQPLKEAFLSLRHAAESDE